MSSRKELDDDQLAHDIEKQGYLLKKTSKGLWVNRYFVTERNTLSYWHDHNSYEQRDNANEKYELADIKNIERTNNRGLIVNFINSSKFKLEIRALMDNERNEWASILEGKSKLYSVDELLSDLRQHTITFQTNTFATLMYLHEKDQNKWILDRLDEVFEISEDATKSGLLRHNSSRLLRAACRALDEYVQVCEDGLKEMSSREPKVVAHTRNYIKRYADILKGRMMLELLYLPGVEKKSFEDLGEKALCSAFELTYRFDELYKYPFVPRDLISTINKTLFSTGDVLAALIKLSVKRVDALFEEIAKIPTMQRSKRLFDVGTMLNEINSLIRDDFDTPSLFRRALQQMVQTQLLAFSDHFAQLDLSEYEETSLMDHIRACDKVCEYLQHVAFDLTNRTFIKDFVSVNKTNGNEEINKNNERYFFIPVSVLDSIKSTCDDSARMAFLRAVYILQDAKKYLLEKMLHELSEGWIGSVLIKALVNTLSTWVDTVKEIMPRKFVRVIYVETSRLLLVMYFQHMISLYRSNKSISLSLQGMEQLRRDFRTINSWIHEHCLPTECLAEKELCLTMFGGFVDCSETDALPTFAHAVRIFGARHELALYDLLRLVLKIRSDFGSKARKNVLALCHDFLTQLHVATHTDPLLLEGDFGHVAILDAIFPLAGVEHCTGTKWKLEKSLDPAATRLAVTLMVTDTINDSMESRRKNTINTTIKEDIAAGRPLGASRLSVEEAMAISSLTALKTHNADQGTSIAVVTSHSAPPPLPARRASVKPPGFKPPPPSTPPPARRATVIGSSCSAPGNHIEHHAGIACTHSESSVTTSSLAATGLFANEPLHGDDNRSTSVDDAQKTESLIAHNNETKDTELKHVSQQEMARQSPQCLPLAPSLRERSDSNLSVSSSTTNGSGRVPPPKPARRASAPVMPSMTLSEQDAIAVLLKSAQQKLNSGENSS